MPRFSDEEVKRLEARLASKADKPIKWRNFFGIMDGIAVALVDQLKPIISRLKAVEQAMEELKAARPTLADSYRGVWQPGHHERGAAVTWQGSLWIARSDTEAKPGTSADWRLAVKRGRAGKDAAG